jgi:NAD+ synthase
MRFGMTDQLTIVLAQLDQSVGDLSANADTMLAVRARHPDADLILFPEMQLIGYPAEDLIMRPALIARAGEQLARLAAATADGGPAMLVGSVFPDSGVLYNGLALLDGGAVAAVRHKHELPNYGTFDEKRHFTPGPLPEPMLFRGVRIGVPICEDNWFPTVWGHLAAAGAELIIAPHGSPYEIDKDDRRLTDVMGRRIAENGLPSIFLNRIGGQDELVFDGCSFVLNADGALAHKLPDWEEAERVTHWSRGADGRWSCTQGELIPWESHPADIYSAMILSLRAYVERNRFPGVLLGLSGGIDSALVAAIAADALGPDRVWCVMLPSRYTSGASHDDAADCAAMIGCRHEVIPIVPAVEAFDAMLSGSFADVDVDITEENIQSRIRGVTLMALSNKFGSMLITTGNKSEMSVGYATIYGDMCGGYNPLKDAYKTTVFAIARWRNANVPRLSRNPVTPVMPDAIITKPPSAELRPDQKDEDSLPAYVDLDKMLLGLVEDELSVDDIVAKHGFDRDVVVRIERLVAIAEYKRRQAPPGVKLGRRNFGRDRRYPITHGFRTA